MKAAPVDAPELEGYDVVQIIRVSPDFWVAYGGMQHETTRRVEVARTFFSGQFCGSRDHGFVFVSRDGGNSWELIDTWTGGGVAEAFVGKGGVIYLLSYLGAARRLEPGPGGYTAEDLIGVDKKNWGRVPYVEDAHVFYFADETTGYISGSIHHMGNHYFRTDDGGYTWKRIEAEEFPFRGSATHPSGEITYTEREIVLLQGRDRSLVADLSGTIADSAWIEEISVDDKGDLLVEVLRLDASDDDLEVIRDRHSVPGPSARTEPMKSPERSAGNGS